MDVVVSDTNVFVALFKSNLLSKVFNANRVNLVIPSKIYDELTSSVHRVKREYPDLSLIITSLRHNQNHGHPISLSVFDYKKVDDLTAMAAHYYLEEQATLDLGEREAIPVTIQLSATFVSCDTEAISEFGSLTNTNGSSAFLFETYCEDLESNGVITATDLQLILKAIRE